MNANQYDHIYYGYQNVTGWFDHDRRVSNDQIWSDPGYGCVFCDKQCEIKWN